MELQLNITPMDTETLFEMEHLRSLSSTICELAKPFIYAGTNLSNYTIVNMIIAEYRTLFDPTSWVIPSDQTLYQNIFYYGKLLINNGMTMDQKAALMMNHIGSLYGTVDLISNPDVGNDDGNNTIAIVSFENGVQLKFLTYVVDHDSVHKSLGSAVIPSGKHLHLTGCTMSLDMVDTYLTLTISNNEMCH